MRSHLSFDRLLLTEVFSAKISRYMAYRNSTVSVLLEVYDNFGNCSVGYSY